MALSDWKTRAEVALIDSLDQEGRGVTRPGGKVVFVEGALPGEKVEIATQRRKPSYDLARVTQVLHPSFARVVPRCPHFGNCGGCSLQHQEFSAQVAAKQRALEDVLWRIGRVRPEQILAPIYGMPWHYRARARLSVRLVPRKGGVLVGFHEKHSSYVADMDSCLVLPQAVSDLLRPLRALIGGLSVADRLPQVEVAAGERFTVLVLRILDPLSADDEAALRAFGDAHGVHLWLQPKGPDTARPFHPAGGGLPSYLLPDFGLELFFRPTEYTQVNPSLNRVLVRRALSLLDPRPGERIADFFCGLGNFTLPIARRGAQVTGFEGSPPLVARGEENARRNGLEGRASFRVLDLFRVEPSDIAAHGRFDKWLVDPPRDGAVELVKALPEDAPPRIVYVSCNPATLARDAAVLTQVKGYRLSAAGVANMFPHTSHVESVAVFERG